MGIRAILFAGASCFILAACSTAPPNKGGGIHVTSQDDTKTLYCTSTGKPCNLAVIEPICVAYACSGGVDYYTTVLVKDNYELNVTWTLPDNYGFCPAEGDGVYLKDNDPEDQFDKSGITGKDVKLDSKKCKNQFKWLAHNKSSGHDYEYRVVFRGPDPVDPTRLRVFVIDPWIVNGR